MEWSGVNGVEQRESIEWSSGSEVVSGGDWLSPSSSHEAGWATKTTKATKASSWVWE